MARPDKVETVKEIAGRFGAVDAALLTEYRGLKVSELAELRGALRDVDAEYKVLKNTLTRLAVREVGLDELVEMLEGPTAVVFCKGDPAAAAKALDDAIKKYPVLVVKGGVLKGKIIGADQARELAKLEPRDVLLAKIAMLANSPMQQTVNVFSALLRDLGSMLAQVVTKKESGELPGGASEAPAEAAATEPAAEAPADSGAPAAEGTETEAVAAPEAETRPDPDSSEESPETEVGSASETDEQAETPTAPEVDEVPPDSEASATADAAPDPEEQAEPTTPEQPSERDEATPEGTSDEMEAATGGEDEEDK